MNNEKLKLGQLKICVEKHLDKHHTQLKNLQSNPKLRAAFLKQFIWPKGSVLKIGFIEDNTYNSQNVPRNTYNDILTSFPESIFYSNKNQIDPLQKIVDNMPVKDAIKKIVNERYVPIIGNSIKILFVDDISDANIRISFNPNDGAWSYVGTQCIDPDNNGKPTMNLGWFDVQTTIHEFGHTFSMVHEHNNPNQNPVKWNKDAVYKWAESTQGWNAETTDQNILTTYPQEQINGSIFDPLSIMLYFFPGYLTTNGIGTQENYRLSGYDVQYLTKLYPNGSQTPEQFYQNTYGESLQSAIQESKNAYDNMINNKKMPLYVIILIIIGIITSIILIFLLFRH